jgi:hypothetical protein
MQERVAVEMKRRLTPPSAADPWSALLWDLGWAMSPEDAQCSDETFGHVLRLFREPRLLAAKDVWQLPAFVWLQWAWFSEPQRKQLRSELEDVFEKLPVAGGAMTVVEILGEKCTDRAGLDALIRLGQRTGEPALHLVPYGLQVFATNTTDERLKEEAVEEIQRLAIAKVPALREEAMTALRALGRLR